jgi:CheY-like chemotaxis protein
MNGPISSSKVFHGIRFLVVDDEPDNVGVVVKLLTLLGGEVASAENGKEGLEQAHTKQPDVILADLSMPVMSGWEMLYQIKQDPALKETPVIALTAHAMNGDRERVLAAGFTSLYRRPSTCRSLSQPCSACSGSSPRRRSYCNA